MAQVIEPEPAQPIATCADIDASWGKDWPATLAALEQLSTTGQTCGLEPLSSKQYAAHFNYAAALEQEGDLVAAIPHYQAAFLINSQRADALNALARLNALPKPTPPACSSQSPARPDPAPMGSPDTFLFVTAQGNQLVSGGQVLTIKGVNYYPRHAPWHRFLKEADLTHMAEELRLIGQAGFNVVRVFLWYEPLFTCQPEDAIPDEAAFAKIDALFQLARENDLKLIVTLNDLPDLVFRPLYTDWARYDTQTTYIVRRYRNEPGILAWDLRNEGDLDYGARPGDTARFSQNQVIEWLAHTSQLVHDNDPYHLLTAGWWGDPTITSPYVDMLSFHHWSDAEQIKTRIGDYQQRSDKPLLLQEVGYHSWAEAPHDRRSEIEQAEILKSVVSVAETQGIAGWIVWTAFDFTPEPGQPASYEHFFGLWRSDLTPKPALEVVSLR